MDFSSVPVTETVYEKQTNLSGGPQRSIALMTSVFFDALDHALYFDLWAYLESFPNAGRVQDSRYFSDIPTGPRKGKLMPFVRVVCVRLDVVDRQLLM